MGLGERLHDLLVVMHHLKLLPRQMRLALLTIEHLLIGRAVAQMLDPPPFMRRPVNPTRRRRLNPILPKNLRKPLSPTL